MKLMTHNLLTRLQQGAITQDCGLTVAQDQTLLPLDGAREGGLHWPAVALRVDEALRQDHQAPAFGVGRRQGLPGLEALAQLGGKQLGVATAKV